MIHGFIDICRTYPQIPLFMAIAVGYFIGKIKIFNFNFGSTAGVLVAALLIGQLDIPVTPLLKSVSFALFIFTIGYKVGARNFSGPLKRKASITYGFPYFSP
jgi:putative transport protein